MGCQTSRSVSVEDGGRPDYKVNSMSSNLYFTELQIDCVKSTWPLISKDKQRNGISIFKDIFMIEPKIKDAFSFGSLEGDTLVSNPAFIGHAQRFMGTIESVCEQLEYADDAESEVTRQLVLLGARHASMNKFDWHHFHVFIKSLHIAWEQALGEEYTEDVREAWAAVFDYIRDKLQDGFNFYIDDRENENLQNGTDILKTQKDTILQVEDNDS